MRAAMIVVFVVCLGGVAQAGDLEWSIGGGIDRTVSRQGDDSSDFMFATGGLVSGGWRVLRFGAAANAEVSEGLGLRIGAVLGIEQLLSPRTRIMLLAESGAHSVKAQDDARDTLPYVGVRVGIDRWQTQAGGRSHGVWLAFQQDVTRSTATHTFEVCPLLGSCRTEQDTYDLGGWAMMLVYRLGHVGR